MTDQTIPTQAPPVAPATAPEIKEETPEQIITRLTEANENLQFFSDPIRFNSIMFQGFKLILEKVKQNGETLAEMKETLTKIEEIANASE